jgi:hypothetical protein
MPGGDEVPHGGLAKEHSQVLGSVGTDIDADLAHGLDGERIDGCRGLRAGALYVKAVARFRA